MHAAHNRNPIGGLALKGFCQDVVNRRSLGSLYAASGFTSLKYDRDHYWHLSKDEDKKTAGKILSFLKQQLEKESISIHSKVDWIDRTLEARCLLDFLELELKNVHRQQSSLLEKAVDWLGFQEHSSCLLNHPEGSNESNLFNKISTLRERIAQKYQACSSSLHIEEGLDRFYLATEVGKSCDYSALERAVDSLFSERDEERLRLMSQQKLAEEELTKTGNAEQLQYVVSLSLIACAAVAGAFFTTARGK